ncbi:hypothetical protein AVEN_79063-1 [Araneus ventricosus]|uniref:Uncharacterized protein n=1 Tax=Araneus ventricosus TaxID=182803 RepID=A0A4Y2IIH3_ARAVE|nr:hypothetical protein AVEN_79063-1 [Araneus ventricosus]
MDLATLGSGQMRPELAPPSLKTSAPHQREDVWPPTYDLAFNDPTNTANPQWNQVSNLESSGPESLPLSHHGPQTLLTITCEAVFA